MIKEISFERVFEGHGVFNAAGLGTGPGALLWRHAGQHCPLRT